jgi:hypothetical protein
MGIKRHKPEEIVSKLRQVEVLVGQGMPRIFHSKQKKRCKWEKLAPQFFGFIDP